MVYFSHAQHLGYANIFITFQELGSLQRFLPSDATYHHLQLKKPGYLIDIDNSDKTHCPKMSLKNNPSEHLNGNVIVVIVIVVVDITII